MSFSDFTVCAGYHPGLIGRVSTLFGRAYVEKWEFDKFFEAKVARELSAFVESYNPDDSNVWAVMKDNEIYGSITVDGSHASSDGAHLRWFILDDHAKGQGLGNLLLETALTFCREKDFQSVYLWTLTGLEPAGALYRKNGFLVEESLTGDQWGKAVEEEKLRLILK